MKQFDYIVVGAGSAGCAVAARLAEDGKTTVLLLEAGPADKNIWIHIPIGYGKTMFNKQLNWQFKSEPEPHLKGREIYQPRGRTLGGSSSSPRRLRCNRSRSQAVGGSVRTCDKSSFSAVVPTGG